MRASLPLYDWRSKLWSEVSAHLQSLPAWKIYVENNSKRFSIHLAVFQAPYLDYILEGKKTVESRFSTVLCPPHGRVEKGDIILLKDSGGPVVGVCKVDRVWFYEIDAATLHELRTSFSDVLCAQDPQFWIDRSDTRYASLMKVSDPTAIPPTTCEKKDRRGWVILEDFKQAELAL